MATNNFGLLPPSHAEVLGRELEEVIQKYQEQITSQVPSINSALGRKKLQPIQLMNESDWQKQQQEAPPQAKPEGMQMRERD